MDWKDVGKAIAKYAPALGTALGGPAGGAVGTLASMVAGAFGLKPDAKPDQVMAAIEKDPQAAVKLKEIETNAKTEMHRLNVQLAIQQSQQETAQIQAVNATIQAESKSEHWPQYSWRPANGFAFPIAVIAVYFVLPLAGKTVPNVPEWVWIGWLSILGVTTYHRGKEKRARAGDITNQGLLAGAIRAIRGES